MRVWVDLTNSPHALFFAPIVRALTERGERAIAARRALRVDALRDAIDAALTAGEQAQLAAAIPLLGRLAAAAAPGPAENIVIEEHATAEPPGGNEEAP